MLLFYKVSHTLIKACCSDDDNQIWIQLRKKILSLFNEYVLRAACTGLQADI